MSEDTNWEQAYYNLLYDEHEEIEGYQCIIAQYEREGAAPELRKQIEGQASWIRCLREEKAQLSADLARVTAERDHANTCFTGLATGSAPMPDTMREEFERWLTATQHRPLLDNWGAEYKRAFLIQTWQAACRAQAKRDAEICRSLCNRALNANDTFSIPFAEDCAEAIEKGAGL